MKESNISFSAFVDAFPESYKNNFSYEGKEALYNYLEELEDDTGEEIEMDIIALCCEFCEYEDVEEYLKDYDTDIKKEEYETDDDIEGFNKAVLEEIREKTTLIEIEDTEKIIIGCY